MPFKPSIPSTPTGRNAGYLTLASYAPSSDVADAGAAISQAVTDALAQSKMLYVPRRRYYMANVLTLSALSGLRIEGDGPDASVFYHDTDHYMMDLRGGTYDTTSTALTVQANPGDTTLTMVSTARLTAGQWINLQSDKIWDATSGKNARCGELLRVKAITSGTVVSLYTPVEDTYALADNSRVNYCPVGSGFSIKAVGFEQTSALGTLTSGAVVLRQFRNPELEDLRFQNLDGPALSYDGCVGGTMRRVNGSDMSDDEANGRFGYLHNIGNATRDLVIVDGNSYNIRHHVTTNAGASATIGGVPRHIRCANLSGTAHTNAVFSTHEEGYDTTFIDCHAFSSLDMGYEMRGRFSKLIGCTADNLTGTGMLIQATATDSEIRDATITNLRGSASARGNPTSGISLACPDTKVDGFTIRTVGDAGIRVIAANRQRIRNGTIIGMGKSANPHGIFFSGASIDHVIENVDVDGEGISSSGMSSASTNQVDGLKVRNFRARGVSNLMGTSLATSAVTRQLDVQVVPGTGATEWVANNRPPRLTTATSTAMTGKDPFIAVTSTSAARTITLPAITAVPTGATYTVIDESNAAGTNNITLTAAGADTWLGGGASKTINTNGGKITFYSNGTNWVQA